MPKPYLNYVRSSAITAEGIYHRRRELLKTLALGATALATGCGSAAAPPATAAATAAEPIPGKALAASHKTDYAGGEAQTSYKDATHYNNYYEFGTGKGDPAETSGGFHPQPWSVEIAGHAEQTGHFTLEDLLKGQTVEERIYRMRCVEGWSMVIPWDGIALGDLLKRFKPTSQAKYVAFTTVRRPAEMPGLKRPVLDWPYREGLRIDEAMHPLAILATGM